MNNSAFPATILRVFFRSDSQPPYCRIQSTSLQIQQSYAHKPIPAPIVEGVNDSVSCSLVQYIVTTFATANFNTSGSWSASKKKINARERKVYNVVPYYYQGPETGFGWTQIIFIYVLCEMPYSQPPGWLQMKIEASEESCHLENLPAGAGWREELVQTGLGKPPAGAMFQQAENCQSKKKTGRSPKKSKSKKYCASAISRQTINLEMSTFLCSRAIIRT